jgi:hypothetical protein
MDAMDSRVRDVGSGRSGSESGSAEAGSDGVNAVDTRGTDGGDLRSPKRGVDGN